MTIIEPGASTSGLVARVKGILLKPDAEWAIIDAEPATVKGLFSSYVVPLAAIPPVCAAIGSFVFGHGMFGVTYRPGIVSVVVTAVLTYVFSLVGLYILALIIDALAPNFGGTKNKVKAFQVAAYSMTAAWVAGVFGLLPAIAGLAIVGGLYGLFLLYKGLPKLMDTPEDKALPYLGVVIVVAIVVNIVIAALVGAIAGAAMMSGMGAVASQGDTIGGKVKIGGTEVDLDKLNAASKQMEATAKQMEASAKGEAATGTVAGAVNAIPGETLKAMLPAQVGGFARTEVESSSGGVGGLQGSNAQGTYTRGEDGRMTLQVTDMAAAGGLAGLAGAFNVNSSKETSTGYEKMGKVNGRMTTEEYDRSGKSGKYGVMVADRFMVEAQGSNVSMDELKAAVSAVSFSQLEGMAKG